MAELSDFDPANHNLAEVRAHLAAADTEELERVKALEAGADQPRKGVLEFTPSVAAIEPDEDGYTRVPVESPYQPGTPIEAPEGDDA